MLMGVPLLEADEGVRAFVAEEEDVRWSGFGRELAGREELRSEVVRVAGVGGGWVLGICGWAFGTGRHWWRCGERGLMWLKCVLSSVGCGMIEYIQDCWNGVSCPPSCAVFIHIPGPRLCVSSSLYISWDVSQINLLRCMNLGLDFVVTDYFLIVYAMSI